MRKYKTLLSFIVVLAIFSFSLYFSKRDARELEKYGKKIKGVIYEKARTKRGTRIRCYFFIGLTEYKTSNHVYLPQSKKLFVGDSVDIIYSSRSPGINTIVYEN